MGSLKSYVAKLDPRLSHLNTSAPKVSVIITNYNYGEYVVDCLESVALQGYPEIECIIVDDASNDDSVSKIRQYLDTNRSSLAFKLVCHDATRGQYAGFRTGLDHASGTLITFLDADDLLLPDFVAEHVRVHLTLPPVAFTSSNQFQIDSEGQVISGVHPDLQTRRAFRLVKAVSLHRPFWVWATTSSMMFRRSVLPYVLGDADEAFRKCADNYLAHFCGLLGGSLLVPAVLGCYRRHQRNTFSKNPLIGGRLPTGDMRDHPTHELMLVHIRQRLSESREEFVALLGLSGLLRVWVMATPLKALWRNRHALQQLANPLSKHVPRLLVLYFLSALRNLGRLLKNRHPQVSIADIEGVKRAPHINNAARNQYYRRDAQ